MSAQPNPFPQEPPGDWSEQSNMATRGEEACSTWHTADWTTQPVGHIYSLFLWNKENLKIAVKQPWTPKIWGSIKWGTEPQPCQPNVLCRPESQRKQKVSNGRQEIVSKMEKNGAQIAGKAEDPRDTHKGYSLATLPTTEFPEIFLFFYYLFI